MNTYTREQLEGDNDREIVLVTSVPVYIVMDADVIKRIVVDDESVDLSTAALADHSKSGDDALDAARLRYAIAMTNDSYWPSWEFGW